MAKPTTTPKSATKPVGPSSQLTLKPRVSEKSYGLSQTRRTYVFAVPSDANKVAVAQAVATQFNVTVESVNIAVVKGKVKRSYRKAGRPTAGQRSNVKKAYVRLKAGDTLPVFDALATEDATPAAKKENK